MDALNGNEFDSAVQHFGDAIRLDPKNKKLSSAFNNRGYALLRLSKLDAAIDDFNEAVARGRAEEE